MLRYIRWRLRRWRAGDKIQRWAGHWVVTPKDGTRYLWPVTSGRMPPPIDTSAYSGKWKNYAATYDPIDAKFLDKFRATSKRI